MLHALFLADQSGLDHVEQRLARKKYPVQYVVILFHLSRITFNSSTFSMEDS